MSSSSRIRSRIIRSSVPIALITALALTSCAAPAPTTDPATTEPQSGGTITLGRVASVTSLDLNNEITANNAFAIDKIFEPLISFDSEGVLVPGLADSWEVSSDGLVYTFALHPGVLFSDATPLTANDVKFSLERHIAVEGPVPLHASITSIEATDDETVTITLAEPYTPFLSEIAQFSNGIFPADFGGKTEEEFFQDPIGTGPFAVDEWDPAGDISFVKNENYWQEGKPYIDALVYKLIPDGTQLLQQLQAGQINAIDEVAEANVEELKANSDVTVTSTGSWVIEQLFLNTQNEYFSDVNVRRAVAQVLDRDGITAATTFGTAEVANSLIPPTIQYSANDEGFALDYDVDAAKADLAKSAYPNGFSVSLMIASGNSLRAQEAQIIQEALAEIGITVTIESIDLATFRTRFFAYDFDFMINSGQSDSPDPNGLISFQADPEGFSQSYWTHYTNDEVTELMKQGRVTLDGPEREQIYLDIQEILANEVPYIPIFYPSAIKATSSNVHGLVVLPNESIRFQDVWIEQ